MPGLLEIPSYAKINIGLKIVGKRDDGYHNIETIFKVIDLHDKISISRRASGPSRILTDDPQLPKDQSNIILKAVRLLEEHTGRSLSLDITVQKCIPMGAGLGGGSSNGAAILTAINAAFEFGLDDATLMALGLRLGSDVPFFVGFYQGRGSTAFGKGRGEMLDYFDWPLSENVVIVNPGIHVSTPWAYQNYLKQLDSQTTENKRLSLTNNSISAILSAPLKKGLFFDNDFEPLVFAEYPKIKRLREVLESKNARLSRMSGSGSTVYGLFDPKVNLTGIETEFADSFVSNGSFV